jgi:3-hydroxyisobutyrate dehydrogenase
MDDAARDDRPAIGIVGIGRMGIGMALRLRELGYAVGVCDIDPSRPPIAVRHGAVVHGDALALAHRCAMLIVAVVDAAQTREVLLGERGALHGLAPGAALMLCPTIAPQDVEELAAAAAARGVDAVDAPMSGGPARARDGTMSMMVACADAVFERWQPLLQDLSARLFRIGARPGDGARVKLVNNLLAAINLAGAAEAMALAQRLGLDVAATLAVIEQSSGQSWIGSDRMRRALAADAAVHAQVALLAKDSALALGMAQQADFVPRLGQAAAHTFAAAVADGLALEDDSSLWRRLAALPLA